MILGSLTTHDKQKNTRDFNKTGKFKGRFYSAETK